MKHVLTLAALVFATCCSTASAQVEFPWNPDSNSDGEIGVDDLLGMLASFGEPWELPDLEMWLDETFSSLLAWDDSLSGVEDSLTIWGNTLYDLQVQLDSAVFVELLNDSMSCVIHGYSVYNWQGGWPVSYSVPTSCLFNWVRGPETTEVCACNYVSISQHRIILPANAEEGELKFFACESECRLCPSLYQEAPGGGLQEVATLTNGTHPIQNGNVFCWANISDRIVRVRYLSGSWHVLPSIGHTQISQD